MSFRRPGRLWIPESPNLILGRGPCPRPTMEVLAEPPKAQFAGFFKAELIDARSGRVKQETGWIRNLIVDNGLDGFAGNSPLSMTTWVGVGTGSTAPANNQTALVAQVGSRISRTTTGDGANGSGPAFAYWYYQRVYLFLEAEGNGNLTEVAVFAGSSSGPMWSRQLFKDGAGNPTVITKTNTDQLKITYEWRVYIPTVDGGGTVTISSILYTWASRAEFSQNAGAWGHLGILDVGRPSGWIDSAQANDATALAAASGRIAFTQFANRDSTTVAAYTGGNFYIDNTHKWEPATANFTGGGIGGFELWAPSGVPAFQMFVTPKFAKDNTKRLTLVVRYAWARYP